MFNQVIGHKDIKDELERHLERERISHAYLFNGNQGIGKYLLSSLFAKSILCQEDLEACGGCQSCHFFDAQTHPDYLLLEGEKTIKVKEVLNLIDFVMLKPILGSKKVVIINEAEKLTPGAQNKLLKILEEPPQYAIIILIINNANNIIDTIKSRGYEIQFKPLKQEEIEIYLKSQYDSEKDYSEVSQLSQGSIKKAVQNLEDVEYISIKELPEKIFNAVIGQDELKSIKLLSNIENITERSSDLMDYMLTWLRDISILKKSRESGYILYSSQKQALLRQSNYFDIQLVMRFVNIIEEAKKLISNHVNSAVVLNYSLLKIQEEFDEYSNRRKI